MLLLQLCYMTCLPVKRFFFIVLEPRVMSFTGKMSKEKKERGKKRERRKERNSNQSSSNALMGNTQLLNHIILSASVINSFQ